MTPATVAVERGLTAGSAGFTSLGSTESVRRHNLKGSIHCSN
jgi:hypothetical protein